MEFLHLNLKSPQDTQHVEDIVVQEPKILCETKESSGKRDRRYVKGNTILGNPSQGVSTRSSVNNICMFSSFISQVKPKSVDEALQDSDWIMATQEELNQFEWSQVWTLFPRPNDQSTIELKGFL